MRTLMGMSLAAAVFALASQAIGATIRVPEDHPTILAGMDAAAPGDTVLVGPGTWTEAETRIVWLAGIPWEVRSLCFAKSGTTLVSTHGRDATVVDLQGAGFLSTGVFLGYLDDPVTIEGFTFTGRTSAIVVGACVESLSSGGTVVRNCRFEGNASPGGAVAAIETAGPAVVEGCEFIDNDASQGGLGVVYAVSTDLAVRGCLFERNDGVVIYTQVGFENDPGHTTIDDSVFRENRARCIVGFVRLMEVRECLFERNSEGAIYSGSLDALVEFCTFAYDSITPGGTGAGVNVGDYEAEIRHCTFVGCHGVGGVSVHPNAEATVTSCVFAYSTGWEALVGSNVTSDCNVFWQNAAGDYGNVVPGPNDLPADPEFCDLEKLDLTVRSTSPCAPENSGPCGQIGAWGVGCGPVSVESKSWGSIKSLYR